MPKSSIPKCAECGTPTLAESGICFSCAVRQREAEKATIVDLYETITNLSDETTRQVMLRQFAEKHFPAILDLPKES